MQHSRLYPMLQAQREARAIRRMNIAAGIAITIIMASYFVFEISRAL